MPNYQKGKIYTIRNYTDNDMIYVGSTTETLSQRLAKHRSACKLGGKYSLYYHIVDNDWTNWYIELYENYPCNDKSELHKREGEIIRLIGNINKNIAGRTKKEYHKENADSIKEQRIKYRTENIINIKKNGKIYYENKKEKYKEKVCCDICGSFLRKDGLIDHRKTIKCMSANNLISPIIR